MVACTYSTFVDGLSAVENTNLGRYIATSGIIQGHKGPYRLESYQALVESPMGRWNMRVRLSCSSSPRTHTFATEFICSTRIDRLNQPQGCSVGFHQACI